MCVVVVRDDALFPGWQSYITGADAGKTVKAGVKKAGSVEPMPVFDGLVTLPRKALASLRRIRRNDA